MFLKSPTQPRTSEVLRRSSAPDSNEWLNKTETISQTEISRMSSQPCNFKSLRRKSFAQQHKAFAKAEDFSENELGWSIQSETEGLTLDFDMNLKSFSINFKLIRHCERIIYFRIVL